VRLAFWRTARPAERSSSPSEQELLITKGVASLRDASARELMTPRIDVIALEAPVTLADVVVAVRRSGRSHYPVYRGDLDHLIGALFVKDLFSVGGPSGLLGAAAETDVTDRVRELYIVPETRSGLEILAEMRQRRRAFAVVVDEYGGFAGVLTINDLVSELVGDLHDEYDRTTSPSIVRIDGRRHLVDGSVSVDDVPEKHKVDIPDGEYVTLGGFLLDALGEIPAEGRVLERPGWTFRIARMDRRRIAKVVLERTSDEEEIHHARSATID